MSFNRGDVVLVPFPFTDLTTQKQRPALVISSKDFNDSSSDAILLAITSQIPRESQPTDYQLNPEEQRNAGLPRPSLVKAGKVVTLSQALVRKTIGKVPEETVIESWKSLFLSSVSGYRAGFAFSTVLMPELFMSRDQS